MNLRDLLDLGITAGLDVDGGLLLDTPKGVLADDLVERIRQSKPGLIAELQGPREHGEHGELHRLYDSQPGKGIDHGYDVYQAWLIQYLDRDPVEVASCPEATHAEILERHPDAVAAEPFTPTLRQPSAPLTAEEETAIRAWLALIEETDLATIAKVIGHCQRDADARDYFTGRAAAELPKAHRFPNDQCDRAPLPALPRIGGE